MTKEEFISLNKSLFEVTKIIEREFMYTEREFSQYIYLYNEDKYDLRLKYLEDKISHMYINVWNYANVGNNTERSKREHVNLEILIEKTEDVEFLIENQYFEKLTLSTDSQIEFKKFVIYNTYIKNLYISKNIKSLEFISIIGKSKIDKIFCSKEFAEYIKDFIPATIKIEII